jgi:16S rRNA processing protein RimM
MPDYSDYFYVGSILKVHGIKGELKLFFDVDEPLNYLHKELFWIDKNGQLKPFHVEYIKPFQGAHLIKFQEINDRTLAESLLSCSLYLPISDLPVLEKENQFYYHEIIKAKVIDEYYGETGIVKEVLEMPAQDLIVILFQRKEILLPITDETIVKWNKTEKILHTRFPVGLREIYLE